jgi:hypothetical protein
MLRTAACFGAGVPKSALKNKKIVYTHSTYLPGLITFLGHLSKLDAVKKLIPGRINKVSASRDRFDFSITTETRTGVKALARLNRSVQEVFVITKDRQAVEEEAQLIIEKYWKKLK